MYKMCHDITIGKYKLRTVSEVKINKSVETLSDIAAIVIPGTFMNMDNGERSKLKIGDKVTIKLGYDGNIKTEFNGYLNSISDEDGTLKLECIDGLYLLKKPIKDEELKNVKLADAMDNYLSQVNKILPADQQITLNCRYDIGYSKITSYKATLYNMLQKSQDELKANIFFSDNTLNVCAPYEIVAEGNPVNFDFYRNIESSELKFVNAEDKQLEVEVVFKNIKGKEEKEKVGQQGGEKKTIVLNGVEKGDLKKIAQSHYNVWVYSGFEGSFTGWLIPFVEPTYKVKLIDKDNKDKEGVYYVIATETNFNSVGGSRKITLGRRLE